MKRKKKFDHNECTKKVCVICTKKATRTRPFSSTDITSLKTHVGAEFNHDDPDYPCGICNGCYLLLDKKRNGDDVQLPVNQTYKSGKKMLVKVRWTDMPLYHMHYC